MLYKKQKSQEEEVDDLISANEPLFFKSTRSLASSGSKKLFKTSNSKQKRKSQSQQQEDGEFKPVAFKSFKDNKFDFESFRKDYILKELDLDGAKEEDNDVINDEYGKAGTSPGISVRNVKKKRYENSKIRKLAELESDDDDDEDEDEQNSITEIGLKLVKKPRGTKQKQLYKQRSKTGNHKNKNKNNANVSEVDTAIGNIMTEPDSRLSAEEAQLALVSGTLPYLINGAHNGANHSDPQKHQRYINYLHQVAQGIVSDGPIGPSKLFTASAASAGSNGPNGSNGSNGPNGPTSAVKSAEMAEQSEFRRSARLVAAAGHRFRSRFAKASSTVTLISPSLSLPAHDSIISNPLDGKPADSAASASGQPPACHPLSNLSTDNMLGNPSAQPHGISASTPTSATTVTTKPASTRTAAVATVDRTVALSATANPPRRISAITVAPIVRRRLGLTDP